MTRAVSGCCLRLGAELVGELVMTISGGSGSKKKQKKKSMEIKQCGVNRSETKKHTQKCSLNMKHLLNCKKRTQLDFDCQSVQV